MEHCTINIEIPDENCAPQNRASPMNGLWKMTSQLGRKRPSQEPVSPSSQPPEPKRLCEDMGKRSVLGRLGHALWNAGGSVAHAAGALGSLAKFRSRREASQNDQCMAPSKTAAEACDAFVLDVGAMLEQKDTGEAHVAENTVNISVPVTAQAPHPFGALPEVVSGVDIEGEYQQLLQEIAQEPMPEPSTATCEDHVYAMDQIVGQEPVCWSTGEVVEPQFVEGSHSMDEETFQHAPTGDIPNQDQVPHTETDHDCVVSIEPFQGHLESGMSADGWLV
eukprot:gnl/MRDRNA2_/MRDRNA2_90424_c0_seq1.p1 gnl/MRDRNA2_/MRDRNA2_90424_c0~~gnl/MRDRNA2_/MRDRNA2_90424_c0_seq1.p1  ORF type:complete len:278 (+),score=58.01 gnl/MRDRNA2_/MRDRNA2_90424_c0_seq1:115-948(+)